MAMAAKLKNQPLLRLLNIIRGYGTYHAEAFGFGVVDDAKDLDISGRLHAVSG